MKATYLLPAVGVHAADFLFGRYFPGKTFLYLSVVCILNFHRNIRVSILVYAGAGSGYSVWMLVRCMVSNVLVFASVIVTLLILWFFLLRGWITGKKLQRTPLQLVVDT